jgi:hypothetical protein
VAAATVAFIVAFIMDRRSSRFKGFLFHSENAAADRQQT